jgi:hypothetical protein
MSDTKFRILGAEIGKPNGFVDVDVKGVKYDGSVVLTDGTDTWTFSPNHLKELRREAKLVYRDSVPAENHQLWTVLTDIGNIRDDGSFADNVDNELRAAQENLFQALVEYGR